MSLYVPDPDELPDAISRQAVREQIAAAENAAMVLEDIRNKMAVNVLADSSDLACLHDVASNLRFYAKELLHVVSLAQQISDRHAPRRPSAELLGRIA